jgi:hypothetical protein
MCLEEKLLVPFKPEIKTFKPFTPKRNSFFLIFRQGKERMSKEWTPKVAGERNKPNA